MPNIRSRKHKKGGACGLSKQEGGDKKDKRDKKEGGKRQTRRRSQKVRPTGTRRSWKCIVT